MIKQMVLINSANFEFMDIDLSKDLFFLGDNASGKTTTTRAIHYLYNAEGRQLGIPKDKDNFEKYYFPYENSYIIYIFDEFFIMTFKRGGRIQKWFSKQKFDLNGIFENKKLKEHREILKYIKSSSFYYHPQTNEEYRRVIYAQDKRYLDFAISSIKNYDAFLEVYNMVFNVDKAIVDMKSIKKAIQKSLQKDDKILSLDFDTYINDMQNFKRDYMFFKAFDKQRDNIKLANSMMQELITLEDNIDTLLRKIKFNLSIAKEKLPNIEQKIEEITSSIDSLKRKIEHWSNRLDNITDRLNDKITDLQLKIKELEKLKEYYSPTRYQESLQLISQKESLQKQRDDITISLNRLKDEQSSVIEEIETQISKLKKMISFEIPSQIEQEFRLLKDKEEQLYDKSIEEINIKYEEIFEDIYKSIEEIEQNIQEYEEIIENLKNSYDANLEELRLEFETNQEIIKSKQHQIDTKLQQYEAEIRKLYRDIIYNQEKIEELERKYINQKVNKFEILKENILEINSKIKEYKALREYKPNSFRAFLAENIQGWEESIYPVIDKSLLTLSNNILKPKLKSDDNTLFGIELDVEKLEKYPTPQEISDNIESLKKERKLIIQKAKEDKINLKSTFDKDKSKLKLSIDELKSKIEARQQNIKTLEEELKKLDKEYKENKNIYEEKSSKLKSNFIEQKSSYLQQISNLKSKKRELERELKVQANNKKREIDKKKEELQNKIRDIKKELNGKRESLIEKIEDEIAILEREKYTKAKDERIKELEEEKEKLDKKLKECFEAEKFLDEYKENISKIEELPYLKEEYKRGNKFLKSVKISIRNKINESNNKIENLKSEYEANSTIQKRLKKAINDISKLNIKLDVEAIEVEDDLNKLILQYRNQKRDYEDKRVDFKKMIDKLSRLNKYAILDINLNIDKLDEVKSIKELEHIALSLETLQEFSDISYDNQKRSRHTDFINYIKNIIPQKLGTFQDLEDSFKEQTNRINRHLSRVDFGAIKNISLEIEHLRNNTNTIAGLLNSLEKKITDAQVMFEDKESLFFDKPKSIKNIDEIIDILNNIKQQSDSGAIHIFDTIDLTLSYTENGKRYKNKSHLKNDSSAGGNILLKVAIAISILALFTKHLKSDTPFFLIIDEVSRLQHKNQQRLKDYINRHGFKTLFITPDPVYPDPEMAIYYMFRNKGDGRLEIVQMNLG